ncbi:MAG: tetratricopeptide repeat protein [Candidatus Helarchaeota archaeon]
MSHEEITSAVQRYNELLETAKRYEAEEKFESAFDAIVKAESIIGKYVSKSEIGNIAYLKGKMLIFIGEYKKAEDLLKKALSISKETKGALENSRIISTLGDLFYQQSDLDLALKYYLEALSLLNEEFQRIVFTRSHLMDEIIKEQITQNLKLSELYYQMNDLENSLKHGSIAIELGDKIGDIHTLLKTQHKLAQIEIKLGKYKTAFNRLIDATETLAHNRKIKDKNLKADIYYGLAEISLKLNNTEDAKAYLKKVYPIIKDSNSKLIKYNYKLGRIYAGIESYKYAIKYFNKAIELSEAIKSRLLVKILFEIGNIYYQMKEYTLAVETLKKCIKTIELQKNFKLEGRINLLIGKILYFQEKFFDASYYFNQAFNIAYHKINDFKGSIIAKNYLGRTLYFQNKFYESLREFEQSFYILRDVLCRDNVEISKNTLNKLIFIVILNIIKLRFKSFKDDNHPEELKKIIGYLEFLKYFQSKEFIRNNIEYSTSFALNWNKNIKRLTKIKKEISIADSRLSASLNYKEIEKLEKIRRNLADEYFSILDRIWSKSIDGISSFPNDPSKVLDRFFRVSEKFNENWAILYVIYSPIDEKLIFFLINPKNQSINYDFKFISLNRFKILINKLINFDKFKKINNYNEYDLILKEFSDNLTKLIPNSIIELINSQNFENITVIPHKFLFKIPWELMKINGKYIFSNYNLSRHYSLDWLRIDLEKIEMKKKSIFFINNPDHGADLELPYVENEIMILKSKLNGQFKFDEIKYMNITAENYLNSIKKKYFNFLHYGGSLILNLDKPSNSKLKLFRHEHIFPYDHANYSFKSNPIILFANLEYEFEILKNNNGYEIFYIYRNLMLSGASGMIYSISATKNIDKLNFYMELYQSWGKKTNISESLSKSLNLFVNNSMSIGNLYWILIGNPFY